MSQPSGKRRKSRELAMQMLFQLDVGKQSPDQVRQTFWKAREEAIDTDTRGFAEDLFRVATSREQEVDELIEHRNLLRLAVAELLGFPGTPVPIVINESLEIAKRYAAPESLGFLNGILDAIAKSRK